MVSHMVIAAIGVTDYYLIGYAFFKIGCKYYSIWSTSFSCTPFDPSQIPPRTWWSCWATTTRRFSGPLRLPINPGDWGAACSILWWPRLGAKIYLENVAQSGTCINRGQLSPADWTGLATELQRPAFNYRPASARRATCVLIDQAQAQLQSEYEYWIRLWIRIRIPVTVQSKCPNDNRDDENACWAKWKLCCNRRAWCPLAGHWTTWLPSIHGP